MIPARHLCVCFALIASLASAQDRVPEAATTWTSKQAVASRHFMIAAANPVAVDVGYRILERGGTAADAAIAVQLVLNLVEPQSSGIGGGAFMLYHDAKRHRLYAYDGRETAPAAATPERFLDANGRPLRFYEAVIGGRSVGVPGVVALLHEAHARHGRLPWATLFEPAIALAEQGFPVAPRMAALVAAESHFTPAARALFRGADDRAPAVGDTMRNPALGATLRRIAGAGSRAFYEGDTARDIVDTVRGAARNPGDIALEDLARYRVKVRTPVCAPYRGYRVCGMPLPSSGGPTLLQMLGILEPYDLAAMGRDTLWSVHFISEAGRLAYADRAKYMADPDYVAPPRGLLDRDYLHARSRLISPFASMVRAEPGVPERADVRLGVAEALELPSTSHISIVDRYGNALAMTTTIEDAFGSRLATRGGFLLNNELTDFAWVPSEGGVPVANRIEGGKRPRSAMAPTIVYDAAGKVAIVGGSAGGPGIINYVAHALIGIIDWKLDPESAIALPHVGSRNAATELERGTAAVALEPKLRALGHPTRIVDQPSGSQFIVRTRTGWLGGADPRRDGAVRGN